MAIYDTMESIKSPVGTLALGYAYNNAGLLLAAGAKVLSFFGRSRLFYEDLKSVP